MRFTLLCTVGLAGLCAGLTLQAQEKKQAATVKIEKGLFDFEAADSLGAWSNLVLPDAKHKEPPAKLELVKQHATSGQQSLKITFAGGRWPTLTTTEVPDDWMAFHWFHADVTVSRPCLVGFTVLQEKGRRFGDWDGAVSRWCKTELLKPGLNHITAALHPPNDYALSKRLGKVVRFEIFMYHPRKGESIYVDNIHLKEFGAPPRPERTEFRVLGTDLVVADVQELGKKLQGRWTRPQDRTVTEVEAAFRRRYNDLQRKFPSAVLAILRDGEKGYDPARPDKPYAGWKDAYWSSHGPDGMTLERTDNRGAAASFEVFMRHRSPLYRVDLSSIPRGSQILAAQLVIVRAGKPLSEYDPYAKPTMWVAEPCNRAWEEYEVNAYQYAKDKFWKRIGGVYYGEDPDFLPYFIAHGPGGGKVNVWDFTEAVRFWTDGQHENHGFMLHGDSRDYMTAWAREEFELKNRPALLVIYVPKR
jgi:hypothetical protein